jgi:hypothetical protein
MFEKLNSTENLENNTQSRFDLNDLIRIFPEIKVIGLILVLDNLHFDIY